MKSKKLHFKVHGEGITSIVRQIYLFEEKQKAWNIMSTLEGITVDQSMAIFEGNAKLTNDPKDDTVVLFVYEEDKEWKEAFRRHVDMLAEQEKESRYVYDLTQDLLVHYDDMKEEEAKQWILDSMYYKKNPTSEGIIKYAMNLIKKVAIAKYTPIEEEISDEEIDDSIKSATEFLEEKKKPKIDELEKIQMDANLQIAKNILVNNLSEKDKDKKKIGAELINKFVQKRYSFEYKGHSFTYVDSARNQGCCPHCDERAPDGFFWKETDEGYLGYYDFGQGEVAVCFECPECFEIFYYHYDKHDFLRRINK